MLPVGLNPYGLTYFLGLQGRGTPRANPNGRGLDGFIEIAREIGARSIELHNGWLVPMDDGELRTLRARLENLGLTPIISSGLPYEPVGAAIRAAVALGATTVRLALTTVLCGDRNGPGVAWPALVAEVRTKLAAYALLAAKDGLALAIENHQDFGSAELVELASETGDNVRICLDTANAFSVGEAPLDFARRVAPKISHVHLKDYNVQFTDEGYRLCRCATGDGAVPVREVVDFLVAANPALSLAIEIGALEARHVRFLRPEWWNGYPPMNAASLAACLAAARRNRLADDADYRTPWERNEDGDTLIAYELDQVRRSADNLKRLGLM